MQSLIYQLSKDDPLWNPERIHDTLVLLDYDPPCADAIRKYMYKAREPRRRSTTWLPFLRNHVHVSRAIDFFTVTTLHNDGLYGHGVRAFWDSGDITEVRTAYRSPWQNPFVERCIGTLRREFPDHVIVLSQGHLERLLQEFIREYYHVARPHQGLAGHRPPLE
jgi:hypothetical protein